jgi:hypothetical protein
MNNLTSPGRGNTAAALHAPGREQTDFGRQTIKTKDREDALYIWRFRVQASACSRKSTNWTVCYSLSLWERAGVRGEAKGDRRPADFANFQTLTLTLSQREREAELNQKFLELNSERKQSSHLAF